VAWLLSRPSEGLGGDGELVVQSRPEGARVLIDDKDEGITPLTVRVSPGTHVLQLRAGSAEPRVIPLQIRPGVQTAQYVELMGVASTGVLEVRSEPSKAKVTIDGQDRGSTPLTLRDVAPGSYQVVLERAGWKSTQVVRVEPGATAQLVVPIR
jgi:PEGA domain